MTENNLRPNISTIYTVGHSNVPAKKIVELLKQHNIQVLVDVRSSPYSKYVPEFNREMFQVILQRENLEYKFAGDYLGGRPKDPTCYKNGQLPDGHADFLHLVDYPAVMTREWYQKGIQHLLDIARRKPTVILCSEEDPTRCHRQHLISQTLLKQGIEVLHIRTDGRLQKAWLLDEPAFQMSFFSEQPSKLEQTESELVYESIEDGNPSQYPDFLADDSFYSPQKPTEQKAKKTSNKKQFEQIVSSPFPIILKGNVLPILCRK